VPDLPIQAVCDDSRHVQPGDLFVAVRGQTVDGHRFLQAAVERGAAALVVEKADPSLAIPQLVVPSTAVALAHLAARRLGSPAERMKLLGVTGTNGKTTSSYLAEALVHRLPGGRPGVIGTVAYRWPGVERTANFTTPTPLELHGTLAEMAAAGCTHVAMECSSHALALDRLAGLRFWVSAFTNLTQDHLDFHQTMEAYFEAKARLFTELTDGQSVVLIDQDPGEQLAARLTPSKLLRVSARVDGRADVRPREAPRFSVQGVEALLDTPKGPLSLQSPLIGAFNLENLVVAVGVGLSLGLSPEAVSAGLRGCTGAPGRLERVLLPEARQLPFGVFVDYAHTPDALVRVMAAIRPLVEQTGGRLLVVFGCGGDRDRTKRPLMGRAVARDADLAFVTSDNPRTEDPGSILEMILDGVRQEPCPPLERDPDRLRAARRGFIAEVDRREAIGLSLAAARPGDAVIIAGKGHEDYQILGKTKHPFDDRIEARRAMEKLASL
jgi:UDP-N-acetylmuramoyl-L-alanyl-D-glutamate--2,6-diaminopimelate ligase